MNRLYTKWQNYSKRAKTEKDPIEKGVQKIFLSNGKNSLNGFKIILDKGTANE